jgi:hypothetical protein
LPANDGADMPIARTKLKKSTSAVFFMIFSFFCLNFHDAANYILVKKFGPLSPPFILPQSP